MGIDSLLIYRSYLIEPRCDTVGRALLMMMRGLQDKSRGHKMLCSLAPNSHKTSVSTFLSLSVASAVDSVNYESEYETCAWRWDEMDGFGFSVLRSL